jgi:hypothetical protein
MILQQAPTFQPQTAGQKSICRLPKYELTLTRFLLRIGGTFTKAQIDRIVVRLGSHVIWDLTGTQLDKINKYKGLYDEETHLSLDFTERDAPDIVGKEIGGIDMQKLRDNVYVDVDINSAATNPTINGVMFLTPPQGDDKDQLVKKYVKVPTPQLSAGRNSINWDTMGALLQRAFMFYTGTDWAASATSAALGTNTGNGVFGAVTVSAGAKIGGHVITMIEPGANVGTFIHEDPDGIIVGHGVVATAYSGGGLAFTIADGATDFVSGDQFTVTVSKATDGNIADLLVKKNGVPIWEEIKCRDARFIQREYNKKPQPQCYVYDPIVDNNQSGAVVTADAASFELRPNLTTGSETITSIFEVLDKPYNL